MCKNFQMIVEHDEYRMISRCEHGTIHLSWNRVTMHFNGEDFEQTLAFLEIAAGAESSISQPQFSCIVSENQSYMQLWLLGTGFYLAPVDLLILTDLMRSAARAMQVQPSTKLDIALQPRRPKPEVQVFGMKQRETMFWLN